MQLTAIQKTTLLDYPGRIATIVFTPGCNLRCGFCHNPGFVLPEEIEKKRHDFIDEDTFFRFLETRMGFLEGVVICGGEPTIHTDLPKFCEQIKLLGFLVKIDTNGSNPKMIKHLLDQRLVDYIAMDIKHTFDGYDSLTGKDIDISQYEESIELIKRKALDYEFRTTLIKGVHTPKDFTKILLSVFRAKKYTIQNYRGDNTLDPQFQGESFNTSELINFKGIAENYVDKCIIRA